MKSPKISVIIPTHNRSLYLDYELEQIYRQKNIDFEVIVVNDIVDEDETDLVVNKYPNLIYIKNNVVQGPSNKHKAGYKIAKGDYFYMPDDDDYLVDEYFFSKAIKVLDNDRSLAFFSGSVILSYEDEEMNVLKEEKQDLCYYGKIDGRQYLMNMIKPASTVSTIFRKSTFDALNAVNMIEMSDTSIYLMALMGGDAFISKDIVARYRLKANSLTTTASLPFLYNVLAQKELFLTIGRNRLINPSLFWAQHFGATYGILYNSKNSKGSKYGMLLWGLMHNHGSIHMIKFVIVEFFRLMVR